MMAKMKMEKKRIESAFGGFSRFLLAALLAAGVLWGCGKEPEKNKKKAKNKIEKIAPKKEKPKEIVEMEEGSFNKIKVRNWSKEEKPEVKADSSNVSIEENQNNASSGPIDVAKKLKVPPGSFAARITQTSRILNWQPKWRYTGAGGPWLPAAELSPDLSVIAIVETIGETEGPFGSRLIFIETYNWNIVRILELMNKKIEKIRFIPGTTHLLCWSSKQVDLKEPNSLFILNARNGRIRSLTKKFHNPFSCIIAGRKGKRVFAKDSGSDKLFVFENLRNLDDFKSIKTGISAPDAPMAVSPDNSEIAALGNGKAEFYGVENLKLKKSFKTGDDYTPDTVLFADSDRNLAAVKKEGAACFFRGDFKVELTDFAGDVIFVFNDRKNGLTLAMEMRKQDEFVLYGVPDLGKISSFIPRKMKPKTKGDTLAGGYLPHSRGIVILDSNGNLMFIYKPTKKWKKKLILSALK